MQAKKEKCATTMWNKKHIEKGFNLALREAQAKIAIEKAPAVYEKGVSKIKDQKARKVLNSDFQVLH